MGYPTEIGGYNETQAAALFAADAQFMLGCQFASLVGDTLFMGVLLMQVYSYFRYQPTDKWWTKLIVGYTFAWNIVITAYYWVYISYLLCRRFGEWLPWLEVEWLTKMPTFDILVVFVVQGFFAYRAYLLNKNSIILLGLIVTLMIASAAGAIGTTAIFGHQTTLLGADKSGPYLITWTACATAADVIIAASIMWALLRSKSGWAHTDKVIGKWLRISFEAQIPPTLLGLAYCIEWSQTPSSLLGALFQALMAKAYTCGLLFSLNARVAMQPVDSEQTTTHNRPQVYTTGAIRPTEINVQVETYVQKDDAHESIDDKYEMQNTHYGSQARLTGNAVEMV